jgi:hypothetical protein
MRTRFIVSYDIAHPKRLRQVAKICQSFGSRMRRTPKSGHGRAKLSYGGEVWEEIVGH